MTDYQVQMITRSVDAYNTHIYFEIVETSNFTTIHTGMSIESLKNLKTHIDRAIIHYNEGFLKW